MRSESEPKVLNLKTTVNASLLTNAVFIGRGSKWGNPFHIGQHGTREEVIRMYRAYLQVTGLIDQVQELRGKDLLCYCKPEPCHGDVLLELANPPYANDNGAYR